MSMAAATHSSALGGTTLSASDEASAINRLKALVSATSMADHRAAIELAADDNIRWDAPPILLEGKDKMRVAVYLAKFAADLDFTPVYSSIRHPTDGPKVRQGLKLGRQSGLAAHASDGVAVS